MGWLEGSLRLMPAWEIDGFGHSLPMSVIIPALVVPGILFTGLALYPFLERWATGDRAAHNLLDRPRDMPARVGVGAAGSTFFALLWLAGGNDVIANTFHIPLFGTTWFFRIAVIVGPVIAFEIARRLALGLQRRDQRTLRHGVETGLIVRTPSGSYVEKERPLTPEEEAVLRSRKPLRPLPMPAVDADGIPPKDLHRPVAKLRIKLNEIYVGDVLPLPNGESSDRPSLRSPRS